MFDFEQTDWGVPEILWIDGGDIGCWTNPEFKQYKQFLKYNEDHELYEGNLYRLESSLNGHWCSIVLLLPYEMYEYMMLGCSKIKDRPDYVLEFQQNLLIDLISTIEIMLIEDVWINEGEQFIFTEFGKAFSEKYGVFTFFGEEPTAIINYLSPDLALRVYGDVIDGFDT